MPDRVSIAVFFSFPVALTLAALIAANCEDQEAAPQCLQMRASHLTDGDSARLDGQSYRLTGFSKPFNAPETKAGSAGRAGAVVSEREAMWGERATVHGRKLLNGGGLLCPTGKSGGFGRPLAVIVLPDGRDFGAEMVGADLATPTERREHEHWEKKRR